MNYIDDQFQEPEWVKVPQLEEDILVLGGPDGPDNWQAKALVERSEWLKKEIKRIELTVPELPEPEIPDPENPDPELPDPVEPVPRLFGDISIFASGTPAHGDMLAMVILTRDWVFPSGLVGSMAICKTNPTADVGLVEIKISVKTLGGFTEYLGVIRFTPANNNGTFEASSIGDKTVLAGEQLYFIVDSFNPVAGLEDIAITLTGEV